MSAAEEKLREGLLECSNANLARVTLNASKLEVFVYFQKPKQPSNTEELMETAQPDILIY